MLRVLPVVTALTGCTFYVTGSGGSGDAGGSGLDTQVAPDAEVTTDAPDDTVSPPLGDAATDSLLPPFDAFVFDVTIPTFDAAIDAPMIDATIDAPTTTWMVIETISVPCNGQVKASQILTSGVTYRVRASGQCKVGEFLGGDILADAEFQGTLLPRDKDNGVDTGIAINDTTLGPNKFPNWGNYTASHVYEISGPGQGAPITLRYHDRANDAYGDNSGALTIEILAQ